MYNFGSRFLSVLPVISGVTGVQALLAYVPLRDPREHDPNARPGRGSYLKRPAADAML